MLGTYRHLRTTKQNSWMRFRACFPLQPDSTPVTAAGPINGLMARAANFLSNIKHHLFEPAAAHLPTIVRSTVRWPGSPGGPFSSVFPFVESVRYAASPLAQQNNLSLGSGGRGDVPPSRWARCQGGVPYALLLPSPPEQVSLLVGGKLCVLLFRLRNNLQRIIYEDN